MKNNYIKENEKNYDEKQENGKKIDAKKYKCLVVIIFQMFIVILLLLYIILFHQCKCKCECGGKINAISEDNKININPTPEEDKVENKETADDVDIPVYPTVWNISKDSSIKLSNPSTNDVYLEYILSDENNDVFYTSPKIKPGESIQAVFYNKLDNGAHNCNMAIKTYNAGSVTANSSVSNSFITIKKY